MKLGKYEIEFLKSVIQSPYSGFGFYLTVRHHPIYSLSIDKSHILTVHLYNKIYTLNLVIKKTVKV